MGVKDARLRARLEQGLPFTDPAGLGSGGGTLQAVSPLNAAAREAAAGGGSASSSNPAPPTLLVCCDAGGGLGGLEPLLLALELPAFAVRLPEGDDLDEAPADVAELAALALKAARGAVPAGSHLVVAGALFAWQGQGPALQLGLHHSTEPSLLPPLRDLQASALAVCWRTSWRCSWAPPLRNRWRWRCSRARTRCAPLPPRCPGCRSSGGGRCARPAPRCTRRWRRPRATLRPPLRPLCAAWPAWRAAMSSWTTPPASSPQR